MHPKKIGFIDHYIDEWHANHYPEWIRETGRGFEVAYAWEATSRGKDLQSWCREQGVTPAASIHEVVGQSDCLIVLAPDNPERHEALADLALRSGKPVYIDKPFAPTRAAAERMIHLAAAHNTPLISSSALRFGPALEEALAGRRIRSAVSRGGGTFALYAIHQLEMIVMALGTGASRVMQCGSGDVPTLVIDYPDERRAVLQIIAGHPFTLHLHDDKGEGIAVERNDNFFAATMEAILTFFETGRIIVPHAETLEIAALLEAGNRALEEPDRWFPLPGDAPGLPLGKGEVPAGCAS